MGIVIGIDTGFANTGLVAAENNDTCYKVRGWYMCKTEKESKKRNIFVASDDVRRVQESVRAVKEFVRQHNPKAVAIELPTAGAKGARAHRDMGVATGSIATIVELLSLPAVFVTPTDVKVAVTGKKSASKDVIMETIRSIYTDVEWPKTKGKFEHVADAMGALMAAQHSELFKLVRGN